MGFGARSKESPLINLFSVDGRSHDVKLDFERLAAGYVRQPTGWSIPEAYLGILVSAAVADGSFHVEEQQQIMSLARRSRALSTLAPNELAAANERVNERLQSRPEALKEMCDTLPADMCLPVYAHCVDIILSDGELQTSEAQFLERMVPMLDIDSESARRVMEVLLLKASY